MTQSRTGAASRASAAGAASGGARTSWRDRNAASCGDAINAPRSEESGKIHRGGGDDSRPDPASSVRARDRGYRAEARIAEGGGSHIIRSLSEKCQAPLKGCAATESAHDTGRRGNSKATAAPLSISHGGRDSRGGTPQAHRRHQKCFDQRVLLSGTFSRKACHARGPDS